MFSPAVCVFAGSSSGTEPDYVNCADSVGRALAAANRPLIYGGGFQGVMGATSKSVLNAGGYVVGVIPLAMAQAGGEKAPAAPDGKGGTPTDKLSNFDLQTHERMENIIADTMHTRKMLMSRFAKGGFIVLPGGLGTFEEVLEVATWSQLGIQAKPIVLANVRGYFDPLRQQLNKGVAAGFIHPRNLGLVKFVDGPKDRKAHRNYNWGKACLNALNQWKPPSGPDLGYVWEKNVNERLSNGLDAI